MKEYNRINRGVKQMKEISELQVKRAVNIIWNGAKDHSFSPDFKAFDENGNADLYWNLIIGAVRRHYEYPKLEALLRIFDQYEDSDLYQSLFWLGLENCTFYRELPERPVLAALRKEYAEKYTAQFPGGDGYHIYEALASCHYSRVLGRKAKENAYDGKLLDELEFSPDMSTDEIVERTEKMFQRWFQIRMQEKKAEKKFFIPGLRKRKASKKESRFRNFGIGYADHPYNAYGAEGDGEQLSRELNTKMSEKELRAFMETKYGRSAFSESETMQAERSLCRGEHNNCHLHFTYGDKINASEIQNGFEALSRQREAEQIEKNRRSFNDNLAQNRISISRLADKIQNSVLLYMQPSPVKSDSGALVGGRVWRAARLEDGRVFEKNEQNNMGDLSVDILLDASTSQSRRQETVSAQGYMIAEALTKCSIPCRVMSFCSMTGYTIVRIFRDYNRPSDNAKIFEYVSNGCNRDGLALSAVHYLMNRNTAAHKLLIILSDVKPNDVIKIRSRTDQEPVPYALDAGVNNTAFEVRRARADGISVICVFTGNDEDVSSARSVYDRDFARIRSLDKLADTVGMLIQNRIKNL